MLIIIIGIIFIFYFSPFYSVLSNSIYCGLFFSRFFLEILVIINLIFSNNNVWIGLGFFSSFPIVIIISFIIGFNLFLIYGVGVIYSFKKKMTSQVKENFNYFNVNNLNAGFRFYYQNFPILSNCGLKQKKIETGTILNNFSILKNELDVETLIEIATYYLFYTNSLFSNYYLKISKKNDLNIFTSYIIYLRERQSEEFKNETTFELNNILNNCKKIEKRIWRYLVYFWKQFFDYEKINNENISFFLEKLNADLNECSSIYKNLELN
jgi:hypothetical protein